MTFLASKFPLCALHKNDSLNSHILLFLFFLNSTTNDYRYHSFFRKINFVSATILSNFILQSSDECHRSIVLQSGWELWMIAAESEHKKTQTNE